MAREAWACWQGRGSLVYGPREQGYWSRLGGLHPRHDFLAAGHRYRVCRAFADFDGDTHSVGEEWTFLGASFAPHDDGVSLFVSLDGLREWQIRMQWRPETQAEILDTLATYIGPG
jgi:hypothetical protein